MTQHSPQLGMSKLTIASFGGGVNSTAMLIGFHQWRQSVMFRSDDSLDVDAILFADTGGEKPETYEHVESFSRWLVAHGFPPITTVREERWTLEQECLTAHTLPSIVVGMRSCSDKFKIRPQDRWVRQNYPGAQIVKLIGFDAGEAHRAERSTADEGRRYPLIEWGWGREQCIAAIMREGLTVPPKSSCFFCPEMKEHEILELAAKHPKLADRALAMERNNSKLVQIKGLARDHSWADVLAFHRDQERLPGISLLPPRPDGLPCMCFDGEVTA